MARVIDEIWVADFETVTVNTKYYKEHEDTKVLLAYTKKLDGTLDFMGIDIQELLYYYQSLQKSIMVYFHNLNFDGDFILKYLIKSGVKLYNKLIKDVPGIAILKNGHQIYEIKYRYYNQICKDYYTIVFRCSYRILSAPVELLGKSVGIKKYQEGEDVNDFYDVEPKNNLSDYPSNFLEYCKRDVEIVRRCLLEFDNAMNYLKETWTFLKFNWKSKLTASAIALKLQKEYVMNIVDKDIVKGFRHSDEDNEIAGEFYFGGFTQFNFDIHQIKTKCTNGLGIDANSMHPYSMTKKLPYGKLYNIDEKDFRDEGLTGDNVCEFYELYVESAELKAPGKFAILANWPKYNKVSNGPIFQFQRYLTEAYGFKCYYLKEEWEAICKYYEVTGVTVLRHWWMKATNYLDGYIREIYKFKEDFKKENKLGLSQTFKIILNGGYGIHAKRNDYDNIYICRDELEYNSFQHGDIINIRGKQNTIHIGSGTSHLIDGCFIHLCKPVEKTKANNKFIASVITAYSRIYLWESMYKCGIDRCAYSDTDSIYFLDAPQNIETLLEMHPTKLGAWDIENKYTDIFVLGAKAYYIKQNDEFVKAKYSGISGKYLKDNLDESTYKSDKLELANLVKKYTKSGVVLIWKDYMPKERNI